MNVFKIMQKMLDVLTKNEGKRAQMLDFPPCAFSQRFCAQNIFVAQEIIAIAIEFFRNNAKNSHRNAGKMATILDFLQRFGLRDGTVVILNQCDVSFPECPDVSPSATCWTVRILPRYGRK